MRRSLEPIAVAASVLAILLMVQAYLAWKNPIYRNGFDVVYNETVLVAGPTSVLTAALISLFKGFDLRSAFIYCAETELMILGLRAASLIPVLSGISLVAIGFFFGFLAVCIVEVILDILRIKHGED